MHVEMCETIIPSIRCKHIAFFTIWGVVYDGNGSPQAHSIQNCIWMVLGCPKMSAIKIVFEWFRDVQKGMLQKSCVNSSSPSGQVCHEHGIQIVLRCGSNGPRPILVTLCHTLVTLVTHFGHVYLTLSGNEYEKHSTYNSKLLNLGPFKQRFRIQGPSNVVQMAPGPFWPHCVTLGWHLCHTLVIFISHFPEINIKSIPQITRSFQTWDHLNRGLGLKV